MRRPRFQNLVWYTALLTSACKSSTGVSTPAPSCAGGVGTDVALAVGAYITLDPASDRGCLRFPANASSTDSAEYLVVPQSASTTPNVSSPFTLTGGAATSAPPVRVPHPSLALRGQGTVPSDFDRFLRRAEETRSYGPEPGPPGPGAAERMVAAGPPAPGSTRSFSVCAKVTCASAAGDFVTVTATVKVLTSHLALYVDDNAPSAGLTQSDLDSLGAQFESRLYAIDTTWFGRESDIDQNGVVMVLMTPVVNQLVDSATCVNSGYVAGFFFGLDLDPTAQYDTRSNHGEVFYSLVADSLGTLSCAHPVSSVKTNVPVTFIHEFQHMISYNQHVLVRGGLPEVLWLNEGLSHFAEELGGRSYLPGDSATFFIYTRGDLYNAYQYLNAPALHPLVDKQGVGGLAQRGGYWLFVRYLVDQFGSGLTRSLESTALTGTANVVTQTGAPFDQTVTRWGLTLWVSDLPVAGFTVPPELSFTSWNLRTEYAGLTTRYPTLFPLPFPLTPVADAGNVVNVTDQISAGSGYYLRALQAPAAAPFTLLLAAPGGVNLPGSVTPRVSVIRIR